MSKLDKETLSTAILLNMQKRVMEIEKEMNLCNDLRQMAEGFGKMMDVCNATADEIDELEKQYE